MLGRLMYHSTQVPSPCYPESVE